MSMKALMSAAHAAGYAMAAEDLTETPAGNCSPGTAEHGADGARLAARIPEHGQGAENAAAALVARLGRRALARPRGGLKYFTRQAT